jgi:protein phosphatase
MTQVFRFKASGRSDVGLARENNEDSGFIGKHYLLVADGMGGHAAGELASATAVSVISSFDKNISQKLNDSEIINEISSKIKNSINKDLSRQGMGTTASLVKLNEESIDLTHVGDSRVYLIRNKQMKQLTKDQTYIQTLIDSGEISEQDSKNHPQKSLLLQAIDGSKNLVPQTEKFTMQEGDKLLLCSDGLTNVVSDKEILEIINKYDYVGSVSALIEKSLELGGPDNITVIVAEITSQKVESSPIVLGAAAEPRNRILLPDLDFPTDIHPFITSEFPALKSLKVSKKIKFIIGFTLLAVPLFLGINYWVSKQFYVSNLGENIAIFQGIKVELGPISLSQPVQSFNLETKVLTKEDLILIEDGIDANSLTEARFIVRRLDQRALCNRDSSFSFCFEVMQSIRPK